MLRKAAKRFGFLKVIVFRIRRICGIGYFERFLKEINYYGDGIATRHLVSFQEDTDFKIALASANEITPFKFSFEYRVAQLLWAGHHVNQFAVPGVVIELGTGYGYSMMALMNGVPLSTRHFFLFDTFDPHYLDEFGNNSPTKDKHPFYAPDLDTVKKNFQEYGNVTFIQGDCRVTLPEMISSHQSNPKIHFSIALLHIDLNFAKTEVEMFKLLYPHLSNNSVVIFDDYAQRNHKDQNLAVKQLAQEFGLNLLETPTGQGVAIISQKSQNKIR